jgi:hypothetical protein
MGDLVVPLTVFAVNRVVHSPVDIDTLLNRPTELRVMHVEPAILRPPGDEEMSLIGEGQHYHSLRPLLWELALRGARHTLLPEIAGGPVAYRAAPGIDLSGLRVAGALPAAILRLQQGRFTLREIGDWPGFDVERASRLLNALYLQSGLIVSRTRQAGFGESFFGALRG